MSSEDTWDGEELFGYVRRCDIRNKLKINISKKQVERARESFDMLGEGYLTLEVDLDHLQKVIEGDNNVTSVTFIPPKEPEVEKVNKTLEECGEVD